MRVRKGEVMNVWTVCRIKLHHITNEEASTLNVMLAIINLITKITFLVSAIANMCLQWKQPVSRKKFITPFTCPNENTTYM